MPAVPTTVPMRAVFALAALLSPATVPAVTTADDNGLGGPRPVISIPLVESPPVLEDFLDMQPPPELSRRLARVEGFIQREPADGRPASQPTHVYLAYDREHLYAVFVAFDAEPDKMRAHVARRENVFGDEIVEVQLDTFNDQRRAFSFVANPYGVQWDAIWTEGQDFDSSWDTVWQSRGKITNRGYVVWMAIPFKSLRFPRSAEQTWGIVLVRDIPRNNESSFWPRVSNRIEGRMNQAATLRGLRDISPGRNAQVIPYATARSLRVLEPLPQPNFVRDDFEGDAGVDAKLVFKDRLALDLTANPDFSQVESDEPQVTVNQRFEVFFPEKRPFFLEYADLFDWRINLLFTRRIADPRAGARLTGKLGKYSLAALAIDDEAPGEVAGSPLPGRLAKFGVLRLVRDVSTQSRVGVVYTGREFGPSFNHVAGADGRLKLNDNWDVRLQGVVARTRMLNGTDLSDQAYSVEFNREGRHYDSHIHYQEIGPDFRTETGFLRRTDTRELHQRSAYTFRPEGERLVAWGPSLFVEWVEDHDGTRLDWQINPEVEWEFRRQTRVGVEAELGRERLRPGDLPGLGLELDFPVEELELSFRTRFISAVDLRTRLAVGRGINFRPATGDPFGADTTRGELELTLRPLRRLRIDNTYLFTRFDDRQGRGRIFTNEILRSRWSWQFDRRLSLRMILQHDHTETNQTLVSLRDGRGEPCGNECENLNADLLLTYLVNPWTAFFVGFNTNERNLQLEDVAGTPVLSRTPGLQLNDARQVFVKLSYLWRF